MKVQILYGIQGARYCSSSTSSSSGSGSKLSGCVGPAHAASQTVTSKVPVDRACSSNSSYSSSSSSSSSPAAATAAAAGGCVISSWFCLYDTKDRLERQFSSGAFNSKHVIQVAPQGAAVLDVLLLEGGKHVAFAAADGSVGLACAESGEMVAALQQQQQQHQQLRPAAALALAHVGGATDAALQQQQQQEQQIDGCLVAGYADGVVRLWCLQQQQQLYGLETSAGGVHALCLASSSSSSSSVMVWAGCSSGDLLLLSIGEARMEQLSLFGGHDGGVLSVALHPATGLFFSGAKDRMVFGYDPRASLRPVCQLPHKDWVASLDAAAHADVHSHILRTGDKRVHAWDLRAPDSPIPEPQHRQHCHKQLISGVRSDALRLVSCSLDGSVLASSLEGAADSSSSSSSGSLATGATELIEAAAAGAAAAATAAATAAAAAAFPRAVGQQHSAWLMAVDFTETRLAAAAADGHVQQQQQQRSSSKACSGVSRGLANAVELAAAAAAVEACMHKQQHISFLLEAWASSSSRAHLTPAACSLPLLLLLLFAAAPLEKRSSARLPPAAAAAHELRAAAAHTPHRCSTNTNSSSSTVLWKLTSPQERQQGLTWKREEQPSSRDTARGVRTPDCAQRRTAASQQQQQRPWPKAEHRRHCSKEQQQTAAKSCCSVLSQHAKAAKQQQEPQQQQQQEQQQQQQEEQQQHQQLEQQQQLSLSSSSSKRSSSSTDTCNKSSKRGQQQRCICGSDIKPWGGSSISRKSQQWQQ
ncbi:hypothetical protein Emed_005694 [Eimeria media]